MPQGQTDVTGLLTLGPRAVDPDFQGPSLASHGSDNQVCEQGHDRLKFAKVDYKVDYTPSRIIKVVSAFYAFQGPPPARLTDTMVYGMVSLPHLRPPGKSNGSRSRHGLPATPIAILPSFWCQTRSRLVTFLQNWPLSYSQREQSSRKPGM